MRLRLAKRVAFYLASVTIFFMGCNAVESHDFTADVYQGLVLPANGGPGRERLDTEQGHSYTKWGHPNIAETLRAHGTPDYIYVQSLYIVVLFYIDTDTAVVHDYGIYIQSSTEVHGIPDSVVIMFEKPDQDKLAEVRRKARSG